MPPTLLKLVTVMVLPFAVRMPPADVMVTVGALTAKFEPEVSRAVVLEESWTVRVPPMSSLRVLMVKVCAVPAEDSNVRLLNSFSPRLAPPNFIVPPVALVKFMVPVPASQLASVESLVQVPVTVHVSLPKSIDEEADEMLTSPVTEAVPDVLVMSPPESVRDGLALWLLLIVRAKVLLASVPPETVKVLSATRAEPRVLVPADTVTVVRVLSVESIVMVPVLSKV